MSRYKELFKAAWLIGGRSVMVNQVCIPTLERGNEVKDGVAVVSGQVKEVSVQYQVGCHSCDSVDAVESRVCPPGYKQTEVGLIPEDWDLFNIGSDATLKARIGWQALTTKEYLEVGDYILVTGTDFDAGTVNWDTCCYVSEWRYKQDSNIQLKENDVLVTKDGTIGKVGLVKHLPTPATLNSGVFVIRPKFEKFSPKYLFYILTSEAFDAFIRLITAGSTITHLYQKDFVHFDFYGPKIDEQIAIAKALSDIDALITSLEKLIIKKQAIKTAAMQQLLTGKKRLPPFDLTHTGYKQTELGEIPEDWEVKSYGQAFTFLTTASNSRSDLHENGDFSYIHYGDIHMKWDSLVDFSIDEITRIDSSKVKNANLLKDGDLIMADASEDYDGIGKSVEVMGLGISNAVSGLHTFLLRDVGVFVDGYRGYLHLIKSTKQSFDRLATGLKVYGLSKGNLKEVLLPVPPKKEQILIVKVLSDMSKEIDALEQRLKKTQQLKQGMMQELLTGRTRLI